MCIAPSLTFQIRSNGLWSPSSFAFAHNEMLRGNAELMPMSEAEIGLARSSADRQTFTENGARTVHDGWSVSPLSPPPMKYEKSISHHIFSCSLIIWETTWVGGLISTAVVCGNGGAYIIFSSRVINDKWRSLWNDLNQSRPITPI